MLSMNTARFRKHFTHDTNNLAMPLDFFTTLDPAILTVDS